MVLCWKSLTLFLIQGLHRQKVTKENMMLASRCNVHPQLLFYRKFNSGHFQTIHGAPFKASTSKYQQQQLEVWSTIFSATFAISNIPNAETFQGYRGYITVRFLRSGLIHQSWTEILYPYIEIPKTLGYLGYKGVTHWRARENLFLEAHMLVF